MKFPEKLGEWRLEKPQPKNHVKGAKEPVHRDKWTVKGEGGLEKSAESQPPPVQDEGVGAVVG